VVEEEKRQEKGEKENRIQREKYTNSGDSTHTTYTLHWLVLLHGLDWWLCWVYSMNEAEMTIK